MQPEECETEPHLGGSAWAPGMTVPFWYRMSACMIACMGGPCANMRGTLRAGVRAHPSAPHLEVVRQLLLVRVHQLLKRGPIICPRIKVILHGRE